MDARIVLLEEKWLTGISRPMTFAENTTAELWRTFMPRRKEILHPVSQNLFSLHTYPDGFFNAVDAHQSFVKCAAMEASGDVPAPEGMHNFLLPGGWYAVFEYKGHPAQGVQVFQYILGTWLPASAYTLDHRPHFEVLGEKYKNNDPESEEEIWIPIKPRE